MNKEYFITKDKWLSKKTFTLFFINTGLLIYFEFVNNKYVRFVYARYYSNDEISYLTRYRNNVPILEQWQIEDLLTDKKLEYLKEKAKKFIRYNIMEK